MAQLIYSVLPNPRRPLISIPPDYTVYKCISLLKANDIGAVAVLAGEKLIGMVGERDIVRHCLQPGVDLSKMIVGEIAYKAVSVLHINDPVEKAMETMTKTKRRHVLISEDNKLVAMLSIGDLLYYLLDDKLRVIAHLEHYITT